MQVYSRETRARCLGGSARGLSSVGVQAIRTRQPLLPPPHTSEDFRGTPQPCTARRLSEVVICRQSIAAFYKPSDRPESAPVTGFREKEPNFDLTSARLQDISTRARAGQVL